MAFVHLHNHTVFSMLDGATRIQDMVNRAVELGMPAVAITDHGYMYGVPDLALACDAVQQTALSGMNLSDGIVRVTVILKPEVFYQVLSEQTGLEIGDEAGLMPCILSLAKASREYEKIRSALEHTLGPL